MRSYRVYGPEAMTAIPVLAGPEELELSLPIGAVLAVLMLSVGLGYRQVVRAYPHGGGSYIVANDTLGAAVGLLAGAGLIEVVSNAVSVFRPPESVPAPQTFGVMVGLLISMFVGVVLVAHFDGPSPGGGQTVLS